MMECKKALVEADGDMDKAVDFLRERGLAAAAKKATRIAAEGVVLPYYDAEAKKGVVVEVNSETDFVAKNEKFRLAVDLLCDFLCEVFFSLLKAVALHHSDKAVSLISVPSSLATEAT